jgi:outer membrane lipoprotein-sorting protein
LKKKNNLILTTLFFFIFYNSYALANFEKKLIENFKLINTLSFDFTQKIGDKTEFGNCYIKYPLLIRCEYPKKNKNIISNGKKFAIVKKRYKKIYFYPLKKTPLFFLLKKENFLNLVNSYNSIEVEPNILEYEVVDDNENKIKIFFDKKSTELLGWKTIDAYSNEVSFLIRNIKKNILIENSFFQIPNEEDL